MRHLNPVRVWACILAVAAVTRADLLGGLTTGANDPISGFLCPTLLQPAIYDCAADCREQHNASTGSCTNEGNCVCSGPSVPHDPFALLTTCRFNFSVSTLPAAPIETPVCHCPSNATPLLSTFFVNFCEADCRCMHGAAGGTCAWGHACICDYPAGYVWTAPERAICLADKLTNLTCVEAALRDGVDPPGC